MNRCTDWEKLASLGPEMRILPKTKVNECNGDVTTVADHAILHSGI
jgi:hypothetical protein